MDKLFAEIITIGNEVLAGYTVNTNATFISGRLRESGIAVKWVTTIADEPDAIKQAWSHAEGRARIIVTTGGLGPTPDDITKKCIADFFNAPLEENEQATANLKQFFEYRRRTAAGLNLDQVLAPRGAEILPNPIGTASGLIMRRDKRVFAFFPGVPSEMKALMTESFIPWLKEHLELPAIHTRLLRTTGIAESRLYEQVRETVDSHPQYALSFLPRQTGVDLRFAFTESDEESLRDWLAFVATIRAKLEKYIFTDEERELHDVLLELLRGRGLSLGVAESFTGGLIGDQLTDIPGSSDVFLGGVTAYDNKVKTSLLGVREETLKKHGAVSEETVREMVRGARRLFNSDCAMATTGIAGPGGATPEKPVGLSYIAARLGEHEMVREFRFGANNRRLNKLRGAMAAMEMLRRLLRQFPDDAR